MDRLIKDICHWEIAQKYCWHYESEQKPDCSWEDVHWVGHDFTAAVGKHIQNLKTFFGPECCGGTDDKKAAKE